MRLLFVWLVTLQLQCGGWSALNAADGVSLELLPTQDTTVYFGEEVARRYRLTNNSQNTAHITPVQQCGCVAMDRSEIVLPKGASYVGTIKINSLLVKKKSPPSLVFSTDVAGTPELREPIEIEVVPFLEAMRPAAKVLAFVPGGTTEEFQVQLRSRKPCGLVAVRTQAEFATAEFQELKRVNDGVDYQIKIAVNEHAPLGKSQIPLIVETSSERWPALLLQINFSRGIVVTPDHFELGIAEREDQPLVKELVKKLVLQDQGVAFRILKVTTDASTSIQWLTKGDTGLNSHVAQVLFDVAEKTGAYAAEIVLHTDRSDQPELRIPVRYTAQ